MESKWDDWKIVALDTVFDDGLDWSGGRIFRFVRVWILKFGTLMFR